MDATSFLARYQPLRRRAEIGFWVLVLGLEAVFNSAVTIIDARQMARPVAAWEPVLWEISSVLVVGALVPAIAAFERRFPLRWDTLARHLPWHLLGSVAFCLVHVLAVFALRRAGYALYDQRYVFQDWGAQIAYEYLKDVRSYVMILAALLSYRFVLLRLQGEARLLDTPDPVPGTPPPAETAPRERPERFLVRKLRREFLIAAVDIEWLQAQGNYVGLHVRGHDYLLRSTLGDFLEQLDPARFVRVHRSYAVNLDAIAEIEPLDAGDARLRMRDSSHVPCSRRYRDALGPRGGD